MNLWEWKKMLVAQSCLTLCDPLDCSSPGFWARILEWVAISFSRGSSWPRSRTWVSYIAGWVFIVWATKVTPNIRSGPLCWPPSNTTSMARVRKSLCAITTAWFQETSKRISKKINISQRRRSSYITFEWSNSPNSVKKSRYSMADSCWDLTEKEKPNSIKQLSFK